MSCIWGDCTARDATYEVSHLPAFVLGVLKTRAGSWSNRWNRGRTGGIGVCLVCLTKEDFSACRGPSDKKFQCAADNYACCAMTGDQKKKRLKPIPSTVDSDAVREKLKIPVYAVGNCLCEKCYRLLFSHFWSATIGFSN